MHKRVLVLLLLLCAMSAQGVLHPSAASALAPTPDAALAGFDEQLSFAHWRSAVARFSGAEIVLMDGAPARILSRDTMAMFTGRPDARAYDYLLAQLRQWYPASALTEHHYPYFGITAKNLILEIPGSSPDTVLLTAHLDSTAFASRSAPGANDNATGSAALLEAARLLRQWRFERTVRLIWFTGEEAGLVGSRNYVRDFPLDGLLGVINLDMIGWDGDGDRCFELDISTLVPASSEVAAAVVEVIPTYNLDLSYDWLETGAIGRSDHVAFWEAGVPAVGIHENTTTQTDSACGPADRNPYYHTAHDTLAENMTPEFAFDVARAGLLAFVTLAQPVEACFAAPPQVVQDAGDPGEIHLSWEPLPEAQRYRIYRSSFGCEAGWEQVYETTATHWSQDALRPDWPYAYQVEAIAADALCASPPSACVSIGPPPPAPYRWIHFPLVTQGFSP